MGKSNPTYSGSRDKEGYCTVYRDGIFFGDHASKRLKVISRNGFDWGWKCRGTDQLSLALLLDVTRDETIALRFYESFRVGVVQHFAMLSWEYSAEDIRDWLREVGVGEPVSVEASSETRDEEATAHE